MTYRRLLLASASRRVMVWVHSLPEEVLQWSKVHDPRSFEHDPTFYPSLPIAAGLVMGVL
jgi:hypothetical protein